jgi:hypothetical protein
MLQGRFQLVGSKLRLWASEDVAKSASFTPRAPRDLTTSPLYEKVDHELSPHFSQSRACGTDEISQYMVVIQANARL